MEQIEFLSPPTYLSPRVHHIICQSTVEPSGDKGSSDFVDQSTLCWSSVDQALSRVSEEPETDSFEYFESVSKALGPCFHEVDAYLSCMPLDGFEQKYKSLLQWTSTPSILLHCIEVLRDDTKSTGTIASLLWSTAVLERSLGDVYLIHGSQCPSMLKDLLLTEELREIFGPTAIQLLRLLMGPAVSLNIRNVTWHGFPMPGEIPKRYGYMILMITVSLGRILEEKSIHTDTIPHRSFITFPQVTDMRAGATGDGWISLKDLAAASECVPCAMLPLWDVAVDLYLADRFGEAVSILLPQLEHMVRRIFAAVNNCSHRLLTAENTVLFTTFDEMLVKELPDGTENHLSQALGDNVMDLLLDLLAYPCGPRVRDRLSHGETDLNTFPIQLADHVMLLCGAICQRFTEPEHHIHKENFIRDIPAHLATYESVFHPVNRTKSQIRQLVRSLDQFSKIQKPQDEGICQPHWEDPSPVCLQGRPEFTAAMSFLRKYLPEETHLAICILPFESMEIIFDSTLSRKLKTLYRWHETKASTEAAPQKTDPMQGASQVLISGSESELVGYLHRVAAQAQAVAQQMCEVLTTRHEQWERKELRSRQRNTYMNMLASVPVLSTGLRLVAIVVTSLLMSIDKSTHTPVQRIRTIKKLRLILQYCENLWTYTSPTKNKWDDAVKSTEQIVIQLR